MTTRERRSPGYHSYLLDILTDGSDHTGHGSVFLTAARSNGQAELGENEDPYQDATLTVLARYALSGLPSPLARLAADQRYKLAQVRSVFLPSLDVCVTSGLAALLLSLSDAGTEKLVVVGPSGTGDFVDGLVDVVLGRRRGWPRVEVCEVPKDERQWWKVYEDEHLVAHAHSCRGGACGNEVVSKTSDFITQSRTVDSGGMSKDVTYDSDERSEEVSEPSSDEGQEQDFKLDSPSSSLRSDFSPDELSGRVSVVYTFTAPGYNRDGIESSESKIREDTSSLDSSPDSQNETSTVSSSSQNDGKPFSFAVLPPGFKSYHAKSVKMLLPLPEDAAQAQRNHEDNRPHLRFILHNNPCLQLFAPMESGRGHETRRMFLDRNIAQLSSHHFATVSDLLCPDSWDGGLLIRSRWQTERLRDAGLEVAFPMCAGGNREALSHRSSRDDQLQKRKWRLQYFTVTLLPSCTSVSLNQLIPPEEKLTAEVAQSVCMLDRRRVIAQRCVEENKGKSCEVGCNSSVASNGGTADESRKQPVKKALSELVNTINQRFQSSPDELVAKRSDFPAAAQLIQPEASKDPAQDQDEISLDDDVSEDNTDTNTSVQFRAAERSLVLNENDTVLDMSDSGSNDNMRFDGMKQIESCGDSQWDKRMHGGSRDVGSAESKDRKCSLPAKANLLDPTVPHLLVLGTGCASPSPVRGSSGYALLFPTSSNGGSNFNKAVNKTSNPRLTLVGLLECGEGTLMSLCRYLPQPLGCEAKNKREDLKRWLQDLSFIWISHGHLDHYSDLPLLVRAVNEAQDSNIGLVADGDAFQTLCRGCSSSTNPSSRKRSRPGGQPKSDDPKTSENCEKPQAKPPPPLPMRMPIVVIAPRKVLRFLDVCLQCRNGVTLETRSTTSQAKRQVSSGCKRLFYGVEHRDFDHSSHPVVNRIRDYVFGKKLRCELGGARSQDFYQPIEFIRNIPVEHCPDAHALILGLKFGYAKTDGAGKPPVRTFRLCFSGDARPSERLVRACWGMGCQPISLLIHEATFDDSQKGLEEAVKKRHSTVSEAVDVGWRVRAMACMLSHFSGRYPRIPPSCVSSPSFTGESEEVRSLVHNNGSGIMMKNNSTVGCAVDGLVVPLTESALSALSLLDIFFAQVFSEV